MPPCFGIAMLWDTYTHYASRRAHSGVVILQRWIWGIVKICRLLMQCYANLCCKHHFKKAALNERLFAIFSFYNSIYSKLIKKCKQPFLHHLNVILLIVNTVCKIFTRDFLMLTIVDKLLYATINKIF